MSSVEIARLTNKQHYNVIRDIRDMLLNLCGEGGALKFEGTYMDAQDKERPCYLLPKRECLILVSGYNITLRAKIIDRWQELEAQQQSQLPLALEPTWDNMLMLVERGKHEYEGRMIAEKKVYMLEDKIEQDAPKVLFADSVTASSTSILIGELAKIIRQRGVEMGQNRLFEWMRKEGYLIRRKGSDYNMPTQKSMELELFEVKETSITHSDGHVSISKTSKITGKGQVYFINKFLGRDAA